MPLPLRYNWKNVVARRTTTLLTLLVVATVVGVFSWLVGFALAIRESFSFARDGRKLIVLKQGATSETNSAIAPEDYNKLTELAGIAVEGTQQLKSPEMIVQVSLPRKRDAAATFANVAVRGVTDAAFRVHRNVRPTGSVFQPGALEVIVGRQAAKQFAGLEPGQVINLGYGGNRGYRIVGTFTADGGPMESEIWGPLTVLMNSYNRSLYSSVSLRLAEGVDPAAVIAQIEGPAIELTAQTEAGYWADQARNIRIYLGIVGVLVGIMCLAAVFAIANTMFASTAGRTREFAMLRTIGFSGRQILAGVVVESVLMSLLGGAVGCAGCAAYLRWMGNTKDMFGAATFTTLGFEIRLTALTIAGALLLVCAVAMLGAAAPAWRAARLEVITALREA